MLLYRFLQSILHILLPWQKGSDSTEPSNASSTLQSERPRISPTETDKLGARRGSDWHGNAKQTKKQKKLQSSGVKSCYDQLEMNSYQT